MKITQEQLDIIATYMDDEIREQVHSELAPCEPIDFLIRYLELEPSFNELLESEFHIDFHKQKRGLVDVSSN